MYKLPPLLIEIRETKGHICAKEDACWLRHITLILTLMCQVGCVSRSDLYTGIYLFYHICANVLYVTDTITKYI